MSFLKSLSFWDWADFISICMVFFGVLFGHIAAKNKSAAADFWEGVLIVGLAVEVISFPRRIAETAQANARAGEAIRQASIAESRTKELESANLQLRIDLATLQKRLKPRGLGPIPDEIAALAKLEQFSGTAINVIVYPTKDDFEMQEFGAGIKDFIKSAGWRVFEPIDGEYSLPPSIRGVSVEVILARESPQTDPKQMAAAGALIKELQTLDIWVSGPQAILPWNGETTRAGKLKLNPEARINIVIGKRP